MTKLFLFAGAALFAVIALGGVAWGAGEVLGGKRTETHTVQEPVRSVTLDVNVGDVEFVPGGKQVSVRETRKWGLRKPTVTRSVRDGVLTVRAHCPGGWFSRCSTNLRVALPAGVAVRVRGEVGDVSGRALATREADVKTNVGDIDLTLAQSPSGLRAETNVGDVDLQVPRGTYAVKSDSDVGDQDVDDLVQDGRAAGHITAVTNVGDASVRGR